MNELAKPAPQVEPIFPKPFSGNLPVQIAQSAGEA